MATEDAREGITHRRVLNIALPITLSNATIPILGALLSTHAPIRPRP
jgi:hypothetical protein